MTFIPEPEYKDLIKKIPIFCGDFLIFAEKKYLLIKRKVQPVKDVYWVIGGRLRHNETTVSYTHLTLPTTPYV